MEFRRIQNAIDLLGSSRPLARKPADTAHGSPAERAEIHAGRPLDPAVSAANSGNHHANGASEADSHLQGVRTESVAPVTAPSDDDPISRVPQTRRTSLVPSSALFAALSALDSAPPAMKGNLPGEIKPKLGIAWGDFHQGTASSIAALLRGPFWRGPRGEDGRPVACPYLRDTRVERRVPVRAVVAAGLWHIAILALPISLFTGLPHRNRAFQNVELTWSGPINDLPLLEIPREKAKATPRVVAPRPLPAIPADAFHPRQRIFTDPVRPTHPRQTLINPAAPAMAPKFLPNLPNMVQLQQVGPAKPRLQITDEMLKTRPREKRADRMAAATPQNAPNMERQVAEMNLPSAQSGPARPKLELKAGAAPRVAPGTRAGDAGPAPDVSGTQLTSANGGAAALIALSANPAPPAPVVPPQGNLAARVSMSPEGKNGGEPGADAAASAVGRNSVGVSVSGGKPAGSASGNNGAAMSAPTPRVLITRPDPKFSSDVEERTTPPDFAALPPGATPEMIFGSRRVYKLNVNMPNLNSSTGSWILNFSEFHANSRPHMESDLSGPVPVKKVDPKYPPTLIADKVEGEVILYAVIRRDGSVDSIQLVRGVDKQLDANAMRALAQWQFRPASKQGVPIELEAIVHIPFRLPEQ